MSRFAAYYLKSLFTLPTWGDVINSFRESIWIPDAIITPPEAQTIKEEQRFIRTGLLDRNNCELVEALAILDAKHDFSGYVNDLENDILQYITTFFTPCSVLNASSIIKVGDPENTAFSRVTNIEFTNIFRDTSFIKGTLNISGRIYHTSIIPTEQLVYPEQQTKDKVTLYEMLSAVTMKNNFAFLIDYDNQHITDRILFGTGVAESNFFLVVNREYYSDPATGTDLTSPKPYPIRGIIVKDNSPETILYSSYNNEIVDSKNDLYINSDIIMEPIINVKNFKIHIKQSMSLNMKTVENPSFENRISQAAELINSLPNTTSKNKFLKYVPFLQKRSGDWCQAISTLDTRRIYNPAIPADAPFILVTGDKILLAYALLVGANVLFLKPVSGGVPQSVAFFYNPNGNTVTSEDELMKELFCTRNLKDTYINILNTIRSIITDVEQYSNNINSKIDTYIENISPNNNINKNNYAILDIFNNIIILIALEHQYKFLMDNYNKGSANNILLTKFCNGSIPKLNANQITQLREIRDFIFHFQRNEDSYRNPSIDVRQSSMISNCNLFNDTVKELDISKYVSLFKYFLSSSQSARVEQILDNLLTKEVQIVERRRGTINVKMFQKLSEFITLYSQTLGYSRDMRGGSNNNNNSSTLILTTESIKTLFENIEAQHNNINLYKEQNYILLGNNNDGIHEIFINLYDRDKDILMNYFSNDNHFMENKVVATELLKIEIRDKFTDNTQDEIDNIISFFDTVPPQNWLKEISKVKNPVFSDLLYSALQNFFTLDFLNKIYSTHIPNIKSQNIKLLTMPTPVRVYGGKRTRKQRQNKIQTRKQRKRSRRT